MIKYVIKRDGRKKDYNGEFIKQAIKNAYVDVYKNEDKFKEEYNFLQPMIENELNKLGKEEVEVEEIQDVVVNCLRYVNIDVFYSYQKYRTNRSIHRELNTDTFKKVKKIINCKDILNSNANVDEASFGGRKFESAGVLMKNYALYDIMPEEFAKAHLNNLAYQHDLDSYAIGEHNCSFVDARRLINETGFETRNGDVRPARSLYTAFQQLAVIFQIQSQEQFGGTASGHIDYDLEPQVNIAFRKHFADGMYYFSEEFDNYKDYFKKDYFKAKIEVGVDYKTLPSEIDIENIEDLYNKYPKIMKYTMRELEKEGNQASQGLYHNLNTLESRPGSQVPFTSINFGRRTTVSGRLICKWLLNASINGIGKFNRTSIFPISIFQYKKGVNAHKGDPNYDEKLKVIESLSHRIYPNIVNGDWSQNKDDDNNPDTWMMTMGCRTLVGFDRHGMGYIKIGRGNVAPVTMNLIKLGIKHGICLGERDEADIEGFWKEFDELIDLSARSLKFRFDYICSQPSNSAPFMYKNKSMRGGEFERDDCVYEVMKHGSLGLGYIGLAEMCQALFGKDFVDDEKVYKFALSVVKHIHDKAEYYSDKYDLNFGTYASPSESTCGTVITGNREIRGLREEFGTIENVTSRDFATNSHHVPVWKHVDLFTKLKLEAPFTKYATSGCITYIELDSGIMNNPKAIEQLIDYAMDLDIPYLAFNFPIDTCLNCGYQSEFNDRCTKCGSTNIEQLRRVTGYLSTDYHKFNHAKQEEVKARFKHSTITKF